MTIMEYSGWTDLPGSAGKAFTLSAGDSLIISQTTAQVLSYTKTFTNNENQKVVCISEIDRMAAHRAPFIDLPLTKY